MIEKKPRRVLVVDDEPMNLNALLSMLKQRGYQVDIADTADAARNQITSHRPDLVLLDVYMPRTSGLDFLEEIRKNPDTADMPVVLMSGHADTDCVVEGLKRGANDFMAKPFQVAGLMTRLEAQIEIAELISRQDGSSRKLWEDAVRDPMSGVYNEPFLFEMLDLEINRSLRYAKPFAVMAIDIDDFSLHRESLGGSEADRLLRDFAQRVNATLRKPDVLCRTSGDKFFALLPETTTAGAMKAARKLCTLVRQTEFVIGDRTPRLTVSIGVAAFKSKTDSTPLRFMEEADEALFLAKKEGKDRAVLFSRKHHQQSEPQAICVIVIDENRQFLVQAMRTLTRAGCEVKPFDRSDQVTPVELQSADLIITDLLMKGISGGMVYSLVREKLGPHVPVIITTTGKMRLRGVSDPLLNYLQKPTDDSNLVAAVKRLISEASLAHAVEGSVL